jgi:TetR/AcrR family transcriptional repressor of nem operon
VFGYIDLRIALLTGPPEGFSCVAGTLLQENFASSEPIRLACAASILGNAQALEADIAAALAARHVARASAASLARHVQTVIQGAFVLAKTADATHAAALARESLVHLRRYFELLFDTPHSRKDTTA